MADLDNPSFPRMSPDGRRLALTVGGNLWVYDLDGRPPIRLSFDGASFTPLWSSDGQRILYESSNGTLASVPADGSTSTPDVRSPTGHFHPAGWLAGGDVVAAQIGTQTIADVVRFTPDAKSDVQPLVRTEAAEGNQGLSVSSDGKWIAYTSDVTGRGRDLGAAVPGPWCASEGLRKRRPRTPMVAKRPRTVFLEDRETVMVAAITRVRNCPSSLQSRSSRVISYKPDKCRPMMSHRTVVSCSCGRHRASRQRPTSLSSRTGSRS